MRILLVEDHAMNQRVALLVLEQLGHKADAVSNGAEAVNAAIKFPYDVILMDVQMPHMDGLTATRLIRKALPEERQPKIIAMTANALAGDKERCLEAGMNDYVSKPLSPIEVAVALERNRPAAPSDSKAIGAS